MTPPHATRRVMYRFHISLHALKPEQLAEIGEPIILDGRKVRPLKLGPGEASHPFDVTFDDAGERLSELPRMFFEPDGSFVWRGERDGQHWQVDGNLYDGGSRLHYVDLKGECPPDEFDRLLTAVGWPRTTLVMQLTRHALFLNEQEFREWAQFAVS